MTDNQGYSFQPHKLANKYLVCHTEVCVSKILNLASGTPLIIIIIGRILMAQEHYYSIRGALKTMCFCKQQYLFINVFIRMPACAITFLCMVGAVQHQGRCAVMVTDGMNYKLPHCVPVGMCPCLINYIRVCQISSVSHHIGLVSDR